MTLDEIKKEMDSWGRSGATARGQMATAYALLGVAYAIDRFTSEGKVAHCATNEAGRKTDDPS